MGHDRFADRLFRKYYGLARKVGDSLSGSHQPFWIRLGFAEAYTDLRKRLVGLDRSDRNVANNSGFVAGNAELDLACEKHCPYQVAMVVSLDHPYGGSEK